MRMRRQLARPLAHFADISLQAQSCRRAFARLPDQGTVRQITIGAPMMEENTLKWGTLDFPVPVKIILES